MVRYRPSKRKVWTSVCTQQFGPASLDDNVLSSSKQSGGVEEYRHIDNDLQE
jgi:hypothetical protein